MSLVVLAMSGGVDSSVSAHRLLADGHEVVGVFMRHGDESPAVVESCRLPILDLPPMAASPHKQGCCTARDAEDARRAADQFGIPFYALDLQADFRRIMRYFVDEYTSGRTPNPCVMCNHWIKFGRLFDFADTIGAQFVATGHYARIERRAEGEAALCRGLDRDKDQAYVLFGIQRRLLDRVLLPVGECHKTEIRRQAAELGLRVASKKDSQEICFVAPGEHARFVAERRDVDTSGELVTTQGTVVGRHEGLERFTVGQRKGLGVALGEPYFVVRIEAESRRVVLGKREELATIALEASRPNWLVDPPTSPRRCLAQIRYNSDAYPARIIPLDEGRFRVEFDEPCFGVAPGQAVVCFDEDRVLGGGWIDRGEAS